MASRTVHRAMEWLLASRQTIHDCLVLRVLEIPDERVRNFMLVLVMLVLWAYGLAVQLLASSVQYTNVYIGECVSGRILTAAAAA